MLMEGTQAGRGSAELIDCICMHIELDFTDYRLIILLNGNGVSFHRPLISLSSIHTTSPRLRCHLNQAPPPHAADPHPPLPPPSPHLQPPHHPRPFLPPRHPVQDSPHPTSPPPPSSSQKRTAPNAPLPPSQSPPQPPHPRQSYQSHYTSPPSSTLTYPVAGRECRTQV